MLIIFSDHAKIKMKQRGLTQSRVKDVLNNPDLTLSSHDGRTITEKNFGKLNLRVVYIKENSNIIIVTAHWTEKKKDENSL